MGSRMLSGIHLQSAVLERRLRGGAREIEADIGLIQRVERSEQATQPDGSLESRLAAVIFDMDGVLADTEPLHEEALNAFLALRGKSLSPTENAAMIGLDYRLFWVLLIERLGLDESIEECDRGYRSMLLPRLAGLRAAPGALELVAALRVAHVRLAVASSSFRPVVDTILGETGLQRAFDVVVSGEEVQRGKPEPDIYLLAAARLGVDPGRCVAVEDSPHGVFAAIAAGMACLGIATKYASAEQLQATRTVSSLSEVTAADLAALAA